MIKNDLKSELDKLMTHPRDTYGIVIQKLVDFQRDNLPENATKEPSDAKREAFKFAGMSPEEIKKSRERQPIE